MKKNLPQLALQVLLITGLPIVSPLVDAADVTLVKKRDEASIPKPTPEQLQWAEAGIGIFVHWSPAVYQHVQLDNLTTPAGKINPYRFDADKLVSIAKSANAGYLVFVAKHCGGYCLWPTDSTPYSIKSSPWKRGKGDMLGDIASACRKENLKLGIYLCPRDDTNKVKDGNLASDPAKQPEEDRRYRMQLEEILSKYGPIFEFWFDGGGVKTTPIDDLFEKYAPGIIQFSGKREGGIRWVGTEHGFAPYPCWNTVNKTPGSVIGDTGANPDGNAWCPAECDVSILRPDWFWFDGSDRKVLTLDELMMIYYLSVGRGANLLINVAPDDSGAVPEAQSARLKEFGDEVKARFGKPIKTVSGAGDSLTLDFGEPTKIDHLRLAEDIRFGERSRAFVIEARKPDGSWIPIVRGSQIAARQIIPVALVTASALRLRIEQSVAPVSIREFSAFFVNRAVPTIAYREGSVRPIAVIPKFTRSADGLFSFDCPTSDWEVRYTLDGAEPTRESAVWREPQALPAGGLVKARFFPAADKAALGGPVLMRRVGLPASRVKCLTPAATLAFDGDEATAYSPGNGLAKEDKVTVTIDLGVSKKISGVGYLFAQAIGVEAPHTVCIFAADTAEALTSATVAEAKVVKTDTDALRLAELRQPVFGRFVRLEFAPCSPVSEIEILAE